MWFISLSVAQTKKKLGSHDIAVVKTQSGAVRRPQNTESKLYAGSVQEQLMQCNDFIATSFNSTPRS
jgi:hypothetical protein